MEISCFHSLMLLVHFFILCTARLHTLTTDQLALLALKANINLETQSVLANNWTTATSVCNWIGITCGGQPQRVIALNLSSMGLKGTVPPHIGNLSSLALLSIQNNSFYGSLSIELARLRSLKTLDFGVNFLTGEIPLLLWSLPELKSLVLKDNNFLGAVPSSLGNITSLKKIDLSHNQLSGSISSNLFNLSSLQIIDLSFNRLSGRLSMDMHLPDLQGLYLSGNQLYGQIPSSLFNCRQLKVLSLSSNSFTGAIPTELGNSTALTELHLSHNDLEGALPPEIGNLFKLEALRVGNNILVGNVPSVVFNISTIQVVSLYENSLRGNLPPIIGFFLPSLVELHLQGNELEGTIPSSISNASKLTLLDLTDNFFTGSMPNSIGNLRNLQKLELAHNHLTSESSMVESNFISLLTENRHLRRIVLSGNPLGSILPRSIGNLSTSLEYFSVSDCSLKGSIPSELGNLSSLIALELANNGLTGIIPNAIGRLQRLQGLHLQSNRLQGTILYDLCKLSSLMELFLGGNELSGVIPECLGNLTALRNISLGDNSLTSKIPSSLWSLKDILAINMSSNSLQGSLPLEIENLRVVIELDLSKNQLSGNIPSSIGNLKNLAYLSLAENKLQGYIPESFSGSISLELLDLSRNNLSGAIPKSLVKLFYLKYFNVSSNDLEGEIPSGGPFDNFSAQSYVMNKALCGVVRLQVPPCKTGTSKGSWRTLFLFLKILLPMIGSIYMLLLINVVVKKCRQKSMIAPRRTERKILYLEIALATDGFSGSNLLGTGSFGSVYKGTMKEGKNVAIKVFNTCIERALRSFQDESKLLSTIGHPNIVRLINSCCDDDFKALVLEYMPNGTLDKWLYTHNYFLNLLQRLDIMIEVASAMVYLHARHIIHCDLKPGNILLDEGMVARVSDFSIAKLLDGQNTALQTSTMATVGYMAPEYGSSGIISEKTDVYGFGILLMETFTRKKPTDEMFEGEMNLRRWVSESLPHAVDRITDATLLEADQEALAAKRKCVLSIMNVSCLCTASFWDERKTMREVEKELQKIKNSFLRDTGFNEREIYPSISHQALLLATDGFNESKRIQFGRSSSIYKAKLLLPPLCKFEATVAIKVFNRVKRGRESFAVESEVLSFIRHRNVVKIFMRCNDIDFKALVLEYISNGSLEKWLHCTDDIDFYPMNVLARLDTMLDVASALCYLHSVHVIHCNLKPSNILLDHNMVAHVNDFSISKRLGERISATKTTTMASAGYMAPEYESTGTVSEKTDVYSFGILLMETFTQKKPTDEMFDGENGLRQWVFESLPHAVDKITDATLLEADQETLAAKRKCIVSIMKVAMCCTAWSLNDRNTMTEVEAELRMIKRQHLWDTGFHKEERCPSISHQELLTATDGFNESKIINFGESYIIYKGELQRYKGTVAVKVFNQGKRGCEIFAVESEVLSFIRHRNVVKILRMCKGVDFKALVLEFIPNGSLEKLLHCTDGICFRYILTMLNIMIDVASALCYLHSMRVIHCNLKPSSVLLDNNMVAYVSDFSIAKRLGNHVATTENKTMANGGYVAPEYESNATISEKTDVYSFGILLMETFTRKKPTDDMFNGEMNLIHWVYSSLPYAVDKIVDLTLLQPDQEKLAAVKECISAIMLVAFYCTLACSGERITMKEAESSVIQIKSHFLSAY
ncbi:hypothetical protein PTKIN_Ptkin04bG0012500 [Pterospermum kingtungense]